MVLFARGAQELTGCWIASGGIGTGNQLAACLALGASGVNLGTALCTTQECPWPQSFKERVVAAKETDTVLMFRELHNTARVFRNATAIEVERIQNEKGKDLQFGDVAELVMGDRGRLAGRPPLPPSSLSNRQSAAPSGVGALRPRALGAAACCLLFMLTCARSVLMTSLFQGRV